MEAKDTVMGDEKLYAIIDSIAINKSGVYLLAIRVAKTQAEISFKAGQESMEQVERPRYPCDNCLTSCRQAIVGDDGGECSETCKLFLEWQAKTFLDWQAKTGQVSELSDSPKDGEELP